MTLDEKTHYYELLPAGSLTPKKEPSVYGKHKFIPLNGTGS